jgi:hypothetical protein
MDGKLKIALRVVILLVLIYSLAAALGAVQGFSVNVGKRKRGRCSYYTKRRCGNRAGWRYTGMVGELVQTQGPTMLSGAASVLG